MNISYRTLTKQDTASYRKMRLECLAAFPNNFGSTFGEESKSAELKFEKFIREENPDNYMLGAFVDSILIGLCGFERQERNKTRHRGEIVQMYVHKDFAGKNIGTKLLKLTISKVFENPEMEQIVLSLVANNEIAEKTYLKIGFVEYGRIANYFKDTNGCYTSQIFMVLNRDNS